MPWSLATIRPVRRLSSFALRPEVMLVLAIGVIVMGHAVRQLSTGPGSADRASLVIARELCGSACVGRHQGGRELQRRAPGYPLILAAMAHLDGEVARGLYCAGDAPHGCGIEFPFLSVVVLQVLAAVLTLLLVYRLALQLSGSQEIAIITLVLAVIWGRFGDAAGNLFAHTWYQLGVVSSLYLLSPGTGHLALSRILMAGVVIGLTALFEPTFIAVAPVAALIVGWPRGVAAEPLRAAVLLLAGCMLGAIPALALACAHGYEFSAVARHLAWHLAERVAFNRLDTPAWWAALVLPTPIYGSMFANFFPSEIINSFGYYRLGTYVFDGTNRILPATLAQPGGAWHQLLWLIKTHVLQEPAAYLRAIPAVLMRGIWGGAGLVALVGIFHVSTLLRWTSAETMRHANFGVVVLTAALLALNTLLSANPIYINPMLAFVYAYAVAYVAGGR